MFATAGLASVAVSPLVPLPFATTCIDDGGDTSLITDVNCVITSPNHGARRDLHRVVGAPALNVDGCEEVVKSLSLCVCPTSSSNHVWEVCGLYPHSAYSNTISHLNGNDRGERKM